MAKVIYASGQMMYSGKLGDKVFKIVNGNQVVTALPKKRDNKTISKKQQEHQKRFEIAARFSGSIGRLLHRKHLTRKKHMTAMNVITSQVLKDRIVGGAPYYRIDYSRVKISNGYLWISEAPKITIKKQELTVAWKSDAIFGKSITAGRCIVLAYCPHFNKALRIDENVKGSTTIQKADLGVFKGKKVYIYSSFVSADEKEVAESVYLGSFKVRA